MKKGKNKKSVNFKAGVKALVFSSVFLYSFVIVSILMLLYLNYTFYEIYKIALRKPNLQDLLIIFSGSILFIVVPFVLGLKMKTKK
jgi:hypothetical protein